MSLAYEYGINTGNRFFDLLDHDEDPDELIATQAKTEEKSKKTSKDVKSATTTTTTKKKPTPTATATASTTNVSSSATKINKENITGKSQNNDQRRQQQTNVLGDNNYQQTRPDSGRGGWQGSARRGGGAGQERPPYEGGSRGGGQQRVQRYNKFEGQQTSTEASGFEQSGEGWRTESGHDNQQFGESRGRGRGRGRGNYEGGRGRGNYEGGRGRGNYEGGRGRGNYEGGRGRGNYEGGRGRGRGGRGNYGNRSIDEASQQQQQQQQPSTQETGGWETSTDANFDNNASAATRTAGQDFDVDVAPQERPFEPGSRRGGRGNFRSRTFHNNRNYGSDRANQQEREGDQEDYRRNRRQHDRQPRSYVSGVKAIEKKDGEGAHNWGSPTENPEDIPAVDETADTAGQAASSSKGWAEQVEEAEKQITLDEYKKQIEAKKRAQQEKVPQFKLRTAGEGEDPKNWKPVAQEYRKKNEGEQGEDDDAEEGDSEGSESGEDTEEQASGKKKVITIPLRFKPIEPPRGGPAGSRGGSRRGGRFHDRPNRDEHPRSKSPSQQQPSYYQQSGEYYNDEQQQQQQQSRPYRGGSGRGGSSRGEYRRSYANSARGSRGGGYTRATSDSNTPDFDNTVDFPTLPK